MNIVNTLADLTIKYFTERNFKLFIKALLTLKEEVIKLDPEKLDPGMVDLTMDENMWMWAEDAASKNPSEYDWEAAMIISADLQSIINESKKD